MFNLLKSKISNFIEKVEKIGEGVLGKHSAVSPRSPSSEKVGEKEVNESQAPYKREGREGQEIEGIKKAALGKVKKDVELSTINKVKTVFFPEIELSEKEVEELLGSFELSLLEADVAYEVADEIVNSLRKKLLGRRIRSDRVKEEVRQILFSVLEEAASTGFEFDLVERVRNTPKPVKILFIGPNGSGKTTTIAKVAHMLLKEGFECVISASDTFRAAAIEQLEAHASRLGIRLIKSPYGADPASVAFDAIKYAKAQKIPVVLIDSAGRQETNKNLLDELKKIVRVTAPDMKIYVGESFGGNAVLEQIREFKSAVGIDGIILTKLDCDSKGGNAISIARATSVPVIYFGTGQNYDDLSPFDPTWIVKNVVG
ncbi:MAG: signal recognition particle-docking protein FtsY [Candidatus Anstonellales archaeon]